MLEPGGILSWVAAAVTNIFLICVVVGEIKDHRQGRPHSLEEDRADLGVAVVASACLLWASGSGLLAAIPIVLVVALMLTPAATGEPSNASVGEPDSPAQPTAGQADATPPPAAASEVALAAEPETARDVRLSEAEQEAWDALMDRFDQDGRGN